MHTGIKKIVEVREPDQLRALRMEHSPAKVNREQGILFVNVIRMSKLPSDIRRYILFHEAGHAALKTTDEIEADAYADELYNYTGGSLRASVHALTRVLSFDNPQHNERALAQLERAYERDGKTLNFDNMTRFQDSNIADIYNDALEAESFFFKKNPQRQASRKAKKDAKAAIKLARADKIANKGLAKLTLAEQGIVDGSGADIIGNITKAVGGIAGAASGGGLFGGLFGGGGGGSSEDGGGGSGSANDPSEGNNTKTWLIIAGVLIVLALAAFFIFRKK